MRIGKIIEFIKAITSLRKGFNSLDVYWKREEACLGIETGETCPALDLKTEKYMYCTECGCPPWPHADMRIKWLTPGSKCPRKMWKDDNGILH